MFHHKNQQKRKKNHRKKKKSRKKKKMISGTVSSPKNPNLTINSSNHHHPHQDLFPPKLSPNFLSFTSNPSSPLFQHAPLHSPPPQSGRFKTQATINDQVVMSETETNLSFYELLGISESGSFSEIKQAYKHLARKYHPDVSPPDRTEEYTKRFIQVQEAYETLSDPNTRALYDRDMARGLHLAFSSRKQEGLMEKNEWRNQWQSQVAGLKDKRMKKKNMSWAAQMRQKRFESEENY